MASSKDELQRWLNTLDEDAWIGVDKGGLMLEVEGSDAYFEIGGMPEKEEEDTVPVEKVDAAALEAAAEREFQRMNKMQKIKDAIEVITNELNGGNRKDVGAAIYGAIATTHRTLQQDFWSAMLMAQVHYADNDSDLRNAEAVRMARAVKELAEKNNWDMGLPRI